MRFVEGIDLATSLERDSALEPGRAALIARQVGAALEHGTCPRADPPRRQDRQHPAGRAGRELHCLPHRFRHSERNSTASTQLTHTGEWIRTLDYVAPEVLDTRRVDARADIYSLGCFLFQMLTGRVPVPRGRAFRRCGVTRTSPRRPRAGWIRGYPATLDAVFQRPMAKDPNDRFASAGDLGRAAQAAATGAPTRLAEQSVAIGAAATGAPDSLAPTRPAGPDARPATPAAEHATRRLADGRGPWRRMAIPLALIAVAGAGAAAAFLFAGGDGGSETGGGASAGASHGHGGELPDRDGHPRADEQRAGRGVVPGGDAARAPGALGRVQRPRRSGTPRSSRRAAAGRSPRRASRPRTGFTGRP